MSATVVSVIVFACVMGGALLGTFVRSSLPEHHLNSESKDIIKLGTGLIATLVALVLGLLVASAKRSYDTKSDELKQASAKIILLDRNLRGLGPTADRARLLLRRTVASRVQLPWRESIVQSLGAETNADGLSVGGLEDEIRELSFSGERDRAIQASALQLSADLTQTRWLIAAQSGATIPMPFIVVVVSWLAVIFASFGLLAPPT